MNINMESFERLVESQDGSHTLISELFEVPYHSKYGAIDESMTVFIEAGLNYMPLRNKRPFKIFEMGFGTGLNALLSMQVAQQNVRSIEYTGIEAYPVDSEMVSRLNYADVLDWEEGKSILTAMHGEKVEESIFDRYLSPLFKFSKIIGKIEDHQFDDKYQVIYYDAFAPTSQPHLWEEEILNKFYNALESGGILVTYCAKGSFKRALKSVGFDIEPLPGPVGKREITRAIKS